MTKQPLSGLAPARLGRITEVIERSIEGGAIPGAVVLVHRHGAEAYFAALGFQDRDRALPMRRDTIFRLASMTKPIVAAAVLSLVEEGRLGLYDSIDPWLPELRERNVMRDPNGSPSDVYRAPRAITLHDLLSFQMGLGWGPSSLRPTLFALTAAPLARAQEVPNARTLDPDAWMKELGALPLAYEPGKQWLYHTPADIAGVLLARVTGKPLEAVLQERIFEPLAMQDASFSVPPEKRARLAVLYAPEADGGGLRVRDDAATTHWAEPPRFPSGGGGLVGSVDDFQHFARMLLGKGRGEKAQVLSRPAIEALSTDTLSPSQHEQPFSNFDRYDLDGSAMWTNRGFGYGVSVRTRRLGLGPNVGSLWWPGAFGTTWLVDPREDLAITLLTQVVSNNPLYTRVGEDVFNAVYQAIAD
jgi:CubicO group peptidase (beta-lactamase class C family)